MKGARIVLYVSALIYFVVSCLSAGLKVDALLKYLDRPGYDPNLDHYEEVAKMLPMACAPAAIVVLLTYLISCVDKD